MKEFKGTKGKWVFKQQGDANEYCIITSDDKWVSALKLNGEQTLEKQLANMNLIAAAPDLLEALIIARKLMLKNGIDYNNADVYNIINIAINKALGE